MDLRPALRERARRRLNSCRREVYRYQGRKLRPVLLLYEPYTRSEMTGSELFKAAFLGIPARRADDVKHLTAALTGVTPQTLLENFRCIKIEYSPLPFKNPYAQSQLTMLFEKA